MLDPFVGTGTTLIECKKRGINSIGIDANPVTAFASRVKTTWDIDLDEYGRRKLETLQLSASLPQLADKPVNQLSFDDLLLDDPEQHLVEVSDQEIGQFLKLIPQNWIDGTALEQTVAIKSLLDTFPADAVTDLLRLALVSVVVSDISNISFGPEVYVSKKKRHSDLYTSLRHKLNHIQRDLQIVQQIERPGLSQVYFADARELSDYINEPVDFVICSPPYPNEKDYTQITRLELILLRYMQNKRDLRAVKEGMIRSHTRNIFSSDHDSNYVEDIPEIQSLAQSIEAARLERGATSGFERLYHRVVTEYFGGMYRVLSELDRRLVSGGKVAFVVGDQMSYFRIPIRTGRLLSLIASRKLGYVELETITFRTRMATATRMGIEEHILILEKP